MKPDLLRSVMSVLVAAGVAGACGSNRADNVFVEPAPQPDAGMEEAGGPPPFVAPHETCKTLDCKRVECEGGGTTTLTGKVYDPAGANPLYNVMVYIPGGPDNDAELPPLKDSTASGVACEQCSNVVLNPLVATLTDTKGAFRLENVPLDANVPIVLQIGKWRRKLHIDITKPCENNAVPDKTLKLPSKSSEGELPQIAVAAGGLDALECLLRGVGIDDSEFVPGHAANGHVHIFNGQGGKMSGAPKATELWSEAAQLKKYDMTLLSCEGSETIANKNGVVALPEYLDAGGRVFATHYHYVWFGESPSPELEGIANFANTGGTESGLHNVNMSFPKGEAFGKWLAEVNSTPVGKITLSQVKDSVVTLNQPATPWITSLSGRPRYFSFNTPVKAEPDKQCGRAVFSDLHITGSAGPTQISACDIGSGGLNEQQKALEFFLFDLSACLSDDTVPPPLPK